MTAPVAFGAADAAPDLATQGASRKTYLAGPRGGMRVPMRQVLLTTGDSVVLYDTSGPYTDATVRTDVRLGLAPVRAAWIAGRGDTAEYDGRTWHAADDGLRTEDLRNLDAVFSGGRRPRRAGAGAVTQLAYARRGVISAEMDYVAVREGLDPEFVSALDDVRAGLAEEGEELRVRRLRP